MIVGIEWNDVIESWSHTLAPNVFIQDVHVMLNSIKWPTVAQSIKKYVLN